MKRDVNIVVLNQYLLDSIVVGAANRITQAHTILLNGKQQGEYQWAETVLNNTVFGYIDITKDAAEAKLDQLCRDRCEPGLRGLGVDNLYTLRGRTTQEAEFVVSDNLLYADRATREEMFTSLLSILERQFTPHTAQIRFYVSEPVGEMIMGMDLMSTGVENED